MERASLILYYVQTGRAEEARRLFADDVVHREMRGLKALANRHIRDRDLWGGQNQARLARVNALRIMLNLDERRVLLEVKILQGTVSENDLNAYYSVLNANRNAMLQQANVWANQNEIMDDQLQELQRVQEINETQILEQDAQEPQD